MPETLRQAAEFAFDKVFSELHSIARKFETFESGNLQKTAKLSEEDVGKIRPHMVRSLLRLEQHAFALGVILDEGIVEGAAFALSWIERAEDGTIQDDSNIRYPWRGTFYEYSNSEWMRTPRITGKDAITGPYVDFDKYLITLSSPIYIEEQFVGVAAADIRLHDFERLVALPLSRVEQDCMICNGEGRIVVSNTILLPIGSIVDLNSRSGVAIGSYDWRIFIP